MDTDREDRIRARAYEIWESEGKPAGREDEHWERARREVDGASADGQSSGTEPADSTTSSGLGNSLQPGGTIPGNLPGLSEGSIGTGGGSTADASTGTARRRSPKSKAASSADGDARP